MFWEMYQMGQIQKAQGQANRAELKSEQLREHFRLLEDRIASLALACQSLWEIVRDNTDISQEDLEAKMEEVDLRDGRKDGKLSQIVDTCGKCGRKTSRRRSTCMYCGHSSNQGEVFGRR